MSHVWSGTMSHAATGQNSLHLDLSESADSVTIIASDIMILYNVNFFFNCCFEMLACSQHHARVGGHTDIDCGATHDSNCMV